MEVWIFAGVIVLLIALAIFAFLRYCGWMHRFEVSTGSPFIENVTLAYKFAMGPYQNCGSIFHEVDKLAPKAIPLGIYYDNPDKVSAANLRYASGVILCEGPKGEADPDVKKALETAGYKFIDLPKMQNCVRTTYPFVYMLSLYFAYSSVYPKLMSYVEEHKLQMKVMVEVYTDNMIKFMSPQDHADDFVVPEAKEAEVEEHRKQDSFLGK